MALTGLLIRIFIAFSSNQIHHPDEIFQYLEQAHRIVFGYSYIPWEYRFGIRSWILPGFISTFLYGFKFLNIDEPVLYINFVKLIFCCISISLVYSTYIVAKQLVSDKAGKIAALFACFWYELIYFAHKPNPEVLATYLFMAALAIIVTKSDNYYYLKFGILCALTVILRLQYAAPVAVLILYVFFNWEKEKIFQSALILLIVIFIAGYIDYLTWGKFFVSYYRNFVFQKTYDVASLFGISSSIYYFGSLTISSMGLFAITGLVSFIYWRNTWLLLICVFIIIFSHSLIPHKEHRFIFLVIPLFLILLSIIVTESILYQKYLAEHSFLLMIFSTFLIISIAGSFNKLPIQKKIYKESIFFQDNVLNSYLFLSNETDISAILNISTPWYEIGGYYYLHQDIPIYSKDHFKLNDIKDYTPYISHIICPSDYKNISGFKTYKKMKSIEIRKQINPPSLYQKLNVNTKKVLQKGVDYKYVPEL